MVLFLRFFNSVVLVGCCDKYVIFILIGIDIYYSNKVEVVIMYGIIVG